MSYATTSDLPAIDDRADPVVARRLRLARRLSERTLKDVADLAGTSESMLSKVENAKASPSVGTLRRLAAALGRPVAWFFGTDGHPVVLSPSSSRTARDGVERILDFEGTSAVLVHLAPGGVAWTPGEREGTCLAFLVEGSASLVTGSGVVALSAGDAFACGGACARSVRPGCSPGRILVVHGPRTPEAP